MLCDLLLVEDNEFVIAYLSKVIGSTDGFNIDNATSLKLAFEKLRAKKYSAIILDLSLPDSNGIDTLKRVISMTDTPVIVLTGTEDDDLKAAALDAGAVDFFAKKQMDIPGFCKRIVLTAAATHPPIEQVRAAETVVRKARDIPDVGLIIADICVTAVTIAFCAAFIMDMHLQYLAVTAGKATAYELKPWAYTAIIPAVGIMVHRVFNRNEKK